MMGKDFAKQMLLCAMIGFVCVATACGSPLNIHEEIQKYEWTDLYQHSHSYEETCEMLFIFLPGRLEDDFIFSLEAETRNSENSWDFIGDVLNECFIPSYGGKYQNGIPVKNRQSYEDLYVSTFEVLRTSRNEYIQMGMIERKR